MVKKKGFLARNIMLSIAACSVFGGAQASDFSRIAVIYPAVREPYRVIFNEIMQGIEQESHGHPQKFEIENEQELDRLKNHLHEIHVSGVVALGRTAPAVARHLMNSIPVVVGAARFQIGPDTQDLSGLTLTPDPAIMLDMLHKLAEGVRRVVIIHPKGKDAWLVSRARDSAKTLGLDIEEFQSENIRESALFYRDFFDKAISGRDALWLPQGDPALEEEALISLIIEESWRKSLVVFSANPEHVRRGTLFSVFPDNTLMGRKLVVMLRDRLSEAGKTSPIIPLRELKEAINTRTADHLGLRATQFGSFDMVFP